MQQPSKPFSFRKTIRGVFSASAKNTQSTTGGTVSSGPIGGSGDLATGFIETSLAALKESGALLKHVPFIAPVAALILQALAMRGVRVRLVS
jgi:hypothetical protein